MQLWAKVFLAVALIAGIFGFTGIAVASTEIAQLFSVFFAILGLSALVGSLMKSRHRRDRASMERSA
ncbi:DUF1328 domain-containing protein [Pseudooceanicola sp. HF7]|uniref:DUF1328 domain-containing protein n=1 Tax=Pseudooceanicola sp. HF7 TaxID=2721560 RepID=UPI001430AAEC|nr:DUF1328 domain-containing protein [Pseudooceanicola sp. HF7]NIZ07833.1 DUF1328 domain-containing protein [Pseudooceanicola sp. HF7]